MLSAANEKMAGRVENFPPFFARLAPAISCAIRAHHFSPPRGPRNAICSVYTCILKYLCVEKPYQKGTIVLYRHTFFVFCTLNQFLSGIQVPSLLQTFAVWRLPTQQHQEVNLCHLLPQANRGTYLGENFEVIFFISESCKRLRREK